MNGLNYLSAFHIWRLMGLQNCGRRKTATNIIIPDLRFRIFEVLVYTVQRMLHLRTRTHYVLRVFAIKTRL